MDEFENKLDEGITFGEELESLDTDLLEAGDYLTIKTKSGSRYIFKVISKNSEGIKIKCVAGPKELFEEEGNLMNDELLVGGKLLFGEDLTNASSVSRLRGIIVTEDVPDLSGKPVEYGKKLDLVETASLEMGDLITIEIKSSTPFYVFEVTGIDKAIYSGENETIEYIQIIVRVRVGKKEHKGRAVRLTSSFIQKNCILKGKYLLEDDDERPFKLRRRIKEILVTKGLPEVVRSEIHSAVVDTVEEIPEEISVEVSTPQKPIIMTGLSEKQQVVLLNLGLNIDEGITENDLKSAWDEFKRKLNNPEERDELIDVFQDFFFKLPPKNMELGMLLKKVRITLNQISIRCFSKEVIG